MKDELEEYVVVLRTVRYQNNFRADQQDISFSGLPLVPWS